MKSRLVFSALIALSAVIPAGGLSVGNYSVTKKVVEGHTTFHLIDALRKMDFGVVPNLGNFAYQFTVNGKDLLITPPSFQAYLEKHWFGWGIPFLAPWANRIDQDFYYFQGKKYLLNDALGNILRVPPNSLPIHGLLVFDPRWEVTKTGGSDTEGAFITSRLEFYKYPDLMAQFPFAQVYEITYRLRDGKLECTTQVSNVGKSPLPVHFGYHPYFRPDGPREDWKLGLGAQQHWIANKLLIPTGETEATDNFLPGATRSFTLDKQFIDDGFSDFARDAKGLGHIWTQGASQKIEVVYGKEYGYAIVYAPLDNTLICIEPQTGPTNAFNLEHEGKFKGLIVLDPGKTFKATYWIIPTGF